MSANEGRMTLRFTLWCLVLCMMFGVGDATAGHNQRSRTTRNPLQKPTASGPLSPGVLNRLAGVDTVGVGWTDDMETSGLWTADGQWHQQLLPNQIRVLTPTINPTMVTLPDDGYLPLAHSGNGLWWFGEAATGTFIGSDFDPMQGSLTGGASTKVQSGMMVSPPISLTKSSKAFLSFWTWWEIEAVQSHSYDRMRVEVSSDGGSTWNDLGAGLLNPVNNENGLDHIANSSGGMGLPGQWTREVFDLSPYTKQTVLVRFDFNSGDASYNGFRGWLIDDVSVIGDTIPAPVITGLTPRIAAPGQVVNVFGGNIANGAEVFVDTLVVPASETSVQDVGRIEFIAPTTLGIHTIRVVNPDGRSSNSLSRSLTITSATPPDIAAIVPDSALAGVATPFTIFGSGFVQGAQVFFGTIQASNTIVSSSTTIDGIVPVSLTPGNYNIGVINPDSLSDLLPLSFRVLPKVIQVVPTTDLQIGQPPTLRVIPPAGTSGITSAKIYFRPGGLALFDSLNLATDTLGFKVALPSAVMTPRGVEYYIVLRAGGAATNSVVITYPASNPVLFPAFLPTFIASITSPVPLVPGSYQMVSVPMILGNPSPLIQFGDDFGPYQASAWRLFRWEKGEYHEFPKTQATLVPGNGFWLGTTSATQFDFRNGISTPSVAPFLVPIDSGWNQVGNPYAFPISWQTVSPINAELSALYLYDGVQYQIGTVLRPYTAAFVYNFTPINGLIEFHPKDASITAGKIQEAEGPASGEFFLRVGASVGGTPYSDSFNRLGFKAGATQACDRLDAPKPPAIGTGVELSIIENQTPYLENFKPLNDQGQSWVVGVRGRGIEGKARVALEQAGSLPPGFEIHVLDLAAQNAVPAGSGGFDVTLLSGGGMRYYKILIGTSAFAEAQSQGIPLEPVAFSLHQNYPNPFNPETRISYDLGALSDVRLEVYSSLGQLVKTLVRGEQTTGSYVVSWDGKSEQGVPVASGVYIARLHAGEFAAARKIMLIR